MNPASSFRKGSPNYALHNSGCLAAAFLLFVCVHPFPAFPAPPEGSPNYALHNSGCIDDLLDEDIDLEDIATDLPPIFDIRTAPEKEMSRLPFFSSVEASRVAVYRDSLKQPDRIVDHIDDIPGLSSIQRFLLEQTLEGSPNYRHPDLCKAQVRDPSMHNSGCLDVLRTNPSGRISGRVRTGVRSRNSENDSPGTYWCRIGLGDGGRFGMTALVEHDPGEPRALDFISMNSFLTLGSSGCMVLAGDFRPGYGEGLVFSRHAFRYRDGVRTLSEEKENPASGSFEETRNLRGIFLKARRGMFASELWTSVRSLDATLDQSGHAVSIDRSGYHPDSGGRGNLNERISGAHVSLDTGRGDMVSVTGAVSKYDPGLTRRPGERFFEDPESKVFHHISISGRHEDARKTFFFEHARMGGNEYATAGGLAVRSPVLALTTQFREYSPRWWAARSGGFSAFGEQSNERGLYSALETELPSAIHLTASVDIARTLGRTFTFTMPASRCRTAFSLRKRFGSTLFGGISARSARDSGADPGRWSVRMFWERGSIHGSPWKARASAAWSQSGEKGGPFAELGMSRFRKLAGLDCTFGLFRIPSYAERYYRFERDVPGRGATQPVWGNGVSASLVVRVKPLSVRYRWIHSDLMENRRELTVQGDWVL